MSRLRPDHPFAAAVRVPLLLATVVLLATACAAQGSTQETGRSEPPAAGNSAAAQEVLATIDGEPITLDDLDDLIGDELATLDVSYGTQRHQLLQAGIEQAIRRHLIEAEAQRQGSTYELLIAERVGSIEVSDAQIEEWYGLNQARLQGRPLEMLRPAIRQFLVDQQQDQIVGALAEELAAAREVEVLIEPFRVPLETEGHPAWGPADAPVTLVEFSDFECPYCAGFNQTLEEIKKEFQGSIRLVFRQFPLTQIHPNALKAAEASLCAEEQGGFWQLHDLMFADQQGLGVPQLKEKAREAGMDGSTFDACLDSGTFAERVQDDLRTGTRLGVSGTPALFVNGRPVEGGAVGFDALAELIEDEIERSR